MAIFHEMKVETQKEHILKRTAEVKSPSHAASILKKYRPVRYGPDFHNLILDRIALNIPNWKLTDDVKARLIRDLKADHLRAVDRMASKVVEDLIAYEEKAGLHKKGKGFGLETIYRNNQMNEEILKEAVSGMLHEGAITAPKVPGSGVREKIVIT